jgi:GDPmannose 4,6-dehydratase
MWTILQQPEPEDFVIATGESHSVSEFLDLAASYLGLDWKKHVKEDARYLRPTEVDFLCGDASKARAKLGWSPKTNFAELVKLMIDNDLELARQETTLTRAGHQVAQRGASQR